MPQLAAQTSPETFTLVPAETPCKSDSKTSREAGGTDEIQSAFGEIALVARRVSAVLGIRFGRLGWEVPRRMVRSNDAVSPGTDEAGRSDAACPSQPDSQLVPSAGDDFRRSRRGI